jgi:hypothetical protein
VPDDLLEAVEAVPVHQLPDVSTRSLKVEVDLSKFGAYTISRKNILPSTK